MAKKPNEIEVSSETPREELELVIGVAARTSESNIQRIAAEARAELARRDEALERKKFDAQERARVKAQQFQEAQLDKQIKAQEQLMGQQIEVAHQQLEAARQQAVAASKQAEASANAAEAARQTAKATKWLAILTAILCVLAAFQIFSVWND